MSKIFYDTCSLLEAQGQVFDTEEKFYISNVTLHELEYIKTSCTKDEETKYKARKILHLLEENEDKYEVVLFTTDLLEYLPSNLPNTNDTQIIACAYSIFRTNLSDGLFHTRDLACRHLAKSIGLKVNSSTKEDEEYTGFITLYCDDELLNIFYSDYLQNNKNWLNLYNNQYVLLKDNTGKIIDKYKWCNNQYQKIQYQVAESRMFGRITPKDNDDYQQIALDCLKNNQLSMLRGPSGSGKTILAFSHMFSLLETGKIDKIIIFCNTVATKGSAKLGFYQGSRTEKLLDSQIGNLLDSKLGGRMFTEQLINDGTLVLLPMSDIRGYDTTGMNAGIYISEAQNLDIELMKLALQRVGEDSIMVVDGDDTAQVDDYHFEGSRNGMKRLSIIFRGEDIYGEVRLKTIHRSKIAEIANKM